MPHRLASGLPRPVVADVPSVARVQAFQSQLRPPWLPLRYRSTISSALAAAHQQRRHDMHAATSRAACSRSPSATHTFNERRRLHTSSHAQTLAHVPTHQREELDLLLPALSVDDAVGSYAVHDDDAIASSSTHKHPHSPRQLHIKLHQRVDLESLEKLATGAIAWDCAVRLSSFLVTHPSTVYNKRIIELGSGTGLVGLTASKLHAERTLLTDRYRLLQLARQNIAANYPNGTATVEAVELDWGNSNDTEVLNQMYPQTNLLLCSDLIFVWDQHDIFRNLADTIVQLATTNSSTMQLEEYSEPPPTRSHTTWQQDFATSSFTVLFAFEQRGNLDLKACLPFLSDIQQRAGMSVRRIHSKEFPVGSSYCLIMLTK